MEYDPDEYDHKNLPDPNGSMRIYVQKRLGMLVIKQSGSALGDANSIEHYYDTVALNRQWEVKMLIKKLTEMMDYLRE